VSRFGELVRDPIHVGGPAIINAMRSGAFLGFFVQSYMSAICVHRRVFSSDHKVMFARCCVVLCVLFCVVFVCVVLLVLGCLCYVVCVVLCCVCCVLF